MLLEAPLLFALLRGANDQTTEPPTEPKPYSETVIVTASRAEELLLNTPVSMTVVPSEQIRSSPASSVGELLQGIAGLNVIQLNAREFEIAGRQATGPVGQGQLVLLDGRVVNNGNGGMYWDQLPIGLDEIDQVEILHGPGSVVWGANAMSAVINIRTKSPREMQGLHLTFGGGEWGTGLGAFRWADASGKFSYKVSGSYYHHDGWPRPTTLPDGSPATGLLNWSNPGTFQPKADVRVDYQADEQRLWSFRLGYGGTSGLLFTNDLPFEFSKSTYMAFGDVSYTSPSIDGRVSWGRSAGTLRTLSDNSTSPFSADFPTAEINMRRVAGTKQLFVFGASTRYDHFDVSVVPYAHSRHDVGCYVEDRLFPNATVGLNLGARLDYVQTSGAAFSPRAAVFVKVAPSHVLRAAVTQGYRAPTPVENFLGLNSAYNVDLAPGASVLVPLTIVGNQNLNEVRSIGFEVGYSGVVARRHTVQATFYRSSARDLIQMGTTEFYSPASPPPGWPFPPDTVPRNALPRTVSYRNTGRESDGGFELSVNSSWRTYLWTVASYTYQIKPELTDADPGFAPAINEPPSHMGSFQVGYSRAPWRGSVGVVFSRRSFWADVLATDPRIRGYSDAYGMVNLMASYAVPRRPVTLVLKGTNLLDSHIQQHAFGDVIRREISAFVEIDLKK